MKKIIKKIVFGAIVTIIGWFSYVNWFPSKHDVELMAEMTSRGEELLSNSAYLFGENGAATSKNEDEYQRARSDYLKKLDDKPITAGYVILDAVDYLYETSMMTESELEARRKVLMNDSSAREEKRRKSELGILDNVYARVVKGDLPEYFSNDVLIYLLNRHDFDSEEAFEYLEKWALDHPKTITKLKYFYHYKKLIS